MTAKPRRKPRKPRRVVLAQGEISFSNDHNATEVSVWVGLNKLYLNGLCHDGERGTLVWEPER